MTPWLDQIRPPRVEDVDPSLAADAAAVRRRSDVPLFVEIPVVLGIALASAAGCGGLWMLLERDQLLVTSLGLAMGIVSIGASWLPLPWFARPLVLVGAVLCRVLLAYAVPEADRELVLCAVEAVMFALHRDRLNKTFAAGAVGLWITWDHGRLHAPGATAGLLVGGALTLTRPWWLHAPAFLRELAASGAMGGLWLAVALACAPGPAWSPAYTAVIGVGTAAAAALAASNAQVSWPGRIAAGLAPLVVAAATVPVPGFLIALLVAILGFAARAPRLWISAMIGLAAYGGWFYYGLVWHAGAKGLAMIGVGAVLIAAGAWFGRAPAGSRARPAPTWHGAVVAGTALLVTLGIVGVAVARGSETRTVLLPLVDAPYAAMGGGVSLELQAERERESGTDIVVLRVGDDGVGEYVRGDDGRPLADDEQRLRLAALPSWYPVEEGTEAAYQHLGYAIVRVRPDGSGRLDRRRRSRRAAGRDQRAAASLSDRYSAGALLHTLATVASRPHPWRYGR
ncbi:MAG: DUF4401 domain-containing protein [Myxococcota bacterium]